MSSKLVSIHRPLVNTEQFRPVTDEIMQRFGRTAITPFSGANLFMNLARRSDLAKMPEWPDDDPSGFHNLIRSILPASFSKGPLTARIERYREIPTGSGWVLFAQCAFNSDLTAEHNAVKRMLHGLDISTRNKYPFRFQIGLGMMHSDFSENYRERLLCESPKIAALDAGKILINQVSSAQ